MSAAKESHADPLASLLAFDPLDAAEKLTGTSYKEDDGVVGLGILLMHGNVQAKEAELLARNDTTFSTETSRYLRIAEEEGFQVIIRDEFDGDDGTDLFYVLWHPDGILLKFDTYWGGESVNGGSFSYNVRPKDPTDIHWDALSSHGPTGQDEVRDGSHDCREALRFNLARLREHFEFVTPWRVPSFHATHLLTYREWELPEAEQEATRWARFRRIPDGIASQIMRVHHEAVEAAILGETEVSS